MADFHLKVSDTLPILEATLVDANSDKINVSAAVEVKFKMRVSSADPFIEIIATIIDDGSVALRGRVDVPWISSNTDEAGLYKAMFKITFPGPDTMSVPNKGCKSILIEADC